MDVTFSRYDPADFLNSEEEIAAYLDAAREDGDTAVVAAALGDVVRARNISKRSLRRHNSRWLQLQEIRL